MESISLKEAMHGKTVTVELLADRDYKDDCQAGTGIVWYGKGDRQQFPAKLWFKLAAHPTVWKLVEGEAENPELVTETADNKAKRLSVIEADRVKAVAEQNANKTEAERQDAERALQAEEAERNRQAQEQLRKEVDAEAQARIDEAAGQGKDLVVVDANMADNYPYNELTEEAQKALTVEEMRALAVELDYGLHARLSEKNLRTEFARITKERIEQMDEEVDTTGVDDNSLGSVTAPEAKNPTELAANPDAKKE